jgi:hypothetical protein
VTSGGDWVEQARRLMETLRAAVPATPTTPTTEPAPEPPASALTGDCRWCPLCQAAAMVRGERPELSAALADILAATSTALRQFAGEAAPEPETPVAEETPERPAPTVQRIELS